MCAYNLRRPIVSCGCLSCLRMRLLRAEDVAMVIKTQACAINQWRKLKHRRLNVQMYFALYHFRGGPVGRAAWLCLLPCLVPWVASALVLSRWPCWLGVVVRLTSDTKFPHNWCFDNVFTSLYDHVYNHHQIIKAIKENPSRYPHPMTRRYLGNMERDSGERWGGRASKSHENNRQPPEGVLRVRIIRHGRCLVYVVQPPFVCWGTPKTSWRNVGNLDGSVIKLRCWSAVSILQAG